MLSYMHLRCIAVLLGAVSGFGQPLLHSTAAFRSRGAAATIEKYASRTPVADAAAVVLLYGSGGTRSEVPYAKEARLFARLGFRVYLPHYLDVTAGRANDPESHYEIWAQAVRDALQYIQSEAGIPRSRTAIVGYSLGGSVALSAAAVDPQLAGVVVWSGSLPDAYRDVRTLPPLLILHGGRDAIIPVQNARQLAALCEQRQFRCDLDIYSGEGHAFSAAGLARANSRILAFLKTLAWHR